MRRIEKRKINKNLLQIILLGVTLAVLIGALIAVKLLSKNGTGGSGIATPQVDIREELGEAVYVGTPIAYQRVEEKYMKYVLVKNRDEDGNLRAFDIVALDDGTFILGYSQDGTTETLTPYLPSIIGAEGSFDLTSLYAVEQNDSYGKIYMLSYLCIAVGTPYFSERIELPSDAEQRQAMIERFGLDSKSASAVFFEYSDTDGTVGSHEILIGARALSGKGFYFMVDGRDVVYYTNSNYFEYALRGFEAFVNGRLVAEGLKYDYSFEPYLTSDYKQWVNTEHKTEGEIITQGASVIASGSSARPFTAGSDYTPDDGFDGYIVEDGVFRFDPERLGDHSDYARLSKILQGKTVGSYTDALYLTLLDELGSSSGGLLNFEDRESLSYIYNIKAIEAVITATDEIRTQEGLSSEGGTVAYNLVKVTYDCFIDGVLQNEYPLHAVLDLSSPLIPLDAVGEIRSIGIGECNVDFEVVYTPDNAPSASESLYISAITAIYSQSGEPISKVTESSFVTLSYYEIISGHRTSTRTITIDLTAEDSSPRWGELRSKLLGKTIGGNLEIKLYSKNYSYELMRGFIEYRIDEIEEFIISELVVSFRYVNMIEQDPFYGESVYENTMDELGYGAFTVYGIDSTVCESVVKVLGGVGGENSNTTSSLGYTGETVALGLTHENMEKYGLYAYTVYFELPRGIYDPSDVDPDYESTTSDDLSDLSAYAWYDTLGFTLYISEEKDGYRYVGSDMYDVIARVPAEDFSFLDYSFTELWARNNFLFMDVENVKELNFDFSLTDYYGSYRFDVSKETIYVGPTSTGGTGVSTKPFEGATVDTRLIVNVTSSENAKYTEYERVKDELGLSSLSLTALYNQLHNGGEDYYASYADSYGVVNYKGIYEKLLRTSYQDRILTESEKSAALSRDKLMRLTVKVLEKDGSVRAGYYAYDFYYVDGTRVMVSAYRTDDAGRVVTDRLCDFTISNYAFENIVLSVFAVLNGETIEDMSGYIDKK